DEREAVVRETARVYQLQARAPHGAKELVVRVEPDVVGPDAGKSTAPDMRVEQRLQRLVDGVPPERVVCVGYGNGNQAARLEHARQRAQPARVVGQVFKHLGENDLVERLVGEGGIVHAAADQRDTGQVTERIPRHAGKLVLVLQPGK